MTTESTLRIWCALLTLLLMGCGSSEPFECIPISGKLIFEDGSQFDAHGIERITLTFVPQVQPLNEKTFPRPGYAEVDVQTGCFDGVTTYNPGDGVVRGRHKVLVNALKKDRLPTQAIPAAYASDDETPLEINAESDDYFELIIR